jgi:hypothetical protein
VLAEAEIPEIDLPTEFRAILAAMKVLGEEYGEEGVRLVFGCYY